MLISYLYSEHLKNYFHGGKEMHEVLEKKKNYYFSDHLKRQLANITNHPLTIIEAPSGFGKTTAVREFLKENNSGEAHEYWHTCLGESSSITYL